VGTAAKSSRRDRKRAGVTMAGSSAYCAITTSTRATASPRLSPPTPFAPTLRSDRCGCPCERLARGPQAGVLLPPAFTEHLDRAVELRLRRAVLPGLDQRHAVIAPRIGREQVAGRKS